MISSKGRERIARRALEKWGGLEELEKKYYLCEEVGQGTYGYIG